MHLNKDIRRDVVLKNHNSIFRPFAIRLSAYYIVLKGRIIKPFYRLPHIMSSEETINYILNNRCSIGRFGDGELDIMIGVWWQKTFQQYDKKLSRRLKELKTNDSFLLCLPDTLNPNVLSDEYLTKQEIDFWKTNIHQFEGYWRKLGNGSSAIGNSFLSRFYMRYKNKDQCKDYINSLRKIWQSRNIIIIEGEKSRCGVNNDLFDNAKSLKRILCPSTNAFCLYDKILHTALMYGSEDILYLIALGHTATVLAWDISKKGYQALDIGHMDIEYEWYLADADSKIPIENKYVKEAIGGDAVTECNDEEYKKQIVEIIS